MKEYTIGEWHAELMSVRLMRIIRNKAEKNVKCRKFKITKGKNPLVFCTVSVLDEDEKHEDRELLHVLSALNEYKGEYAEQWSGGCLDE